MPVVINEFEVVPDAPPPSRPVPTPAQPAELTPRAVIAIVKQHVERSARVRAH